MKYSIVIPAYNEEKRIGKTIETIWDYFAKKGPEFEVIISDDGSCDSTVKVIQKSQQKYKNLILLEGRHSGKGLAIRRGMEAASGEIILFTDTDLATPISEFEKFLPKFEAGSDVVIGSRGMTRVGAPLPRLIMAWGLIFLAKIFLGLNFSDTQCGFKAFKKEALTKILPKLKIHGGDKVVAGARVTASFDLELLFLAKKLKLKISEVPVEWYHQASKAVRVVIESVLTLIDIFKIRICNFQGKYS